MLYSAENPPGEPLSIHIPLKTMNDTPPTTEEVCEALKRMKSFKAPGGSGIRVEHLREWMEHANSDTICDQKYVTAWNHVLELVNMAFTGEPLPKSFGVGILVLIPKDVPDQFRGIALLEVIYKLISAIINRRFQDTVEFHDAIHGFRQNRGTGTAIISVKLIMQLAKRTANPRYFVFLDLKKLMTRWTENAHWKYYRDTEWDQKYEESLRKFGT